MIPYWYVPAWYRDRTGGLLLIVFISIDAQYEGKVLCVVAGCLSVFVGGGHYCCCRYVSLTVCAKVSTIFVCFCFIFQVTVIFFFVLVVCFFYLCRVCQDFECSGRPFVIQSDAASRKRPFSTGFFSTGFLWSLY